MQNIAPQEADLMAFGQRSHTRVPGDAVVSVERLGPDGTPLPDVEEDLCMLMNISEGGVAFRTTSMPSLGGKVNISIGLGNGYIVAEAEIKFVGVADEEGTCEVGAEFTYLSEESLKMVARLVELRRNSGM